MLRKLLLIFLIFFFLLFLSYLLIILYPYSKSRILEIVKKFGFFAPFVLIFFHSFQVIVAPIPGQVFPFLMGFLYGAYLGSIMAITGNLIGSFTSFFLGKFGERKLVSTNKLKALENYRIKIVSRSILWLSLLFILPIPGLPKDLLCYFAGFIGVKEKDFLLSLLFGRIPVEILWVLAGSGIYKFFIPPN
ncbi:MAG: VTT domain-containing protein [candidate division WOR-3 bacterium]